MTVIRKIVAGVVVAIALVIGALQVLEKDQDKAPNETNAAEKSEAPGSEKAAELEKTPRSTPREAKPVAKRATSPAKKTKPAERAKNRGPPVWEKPEQQRPSQVLVALPGGKRIDIGPTLERIRKGIKHSHRNDGSVFRNRERRLPIHPRGYYREYVHPTPGRRGPGARRVVIGKKGETYYTHDHYETFIRVNGKR